MKTYKVRKIGDRGMGIAVPNLIAQLLKWKLGDNLTFKIEKDKLVVEKAKEK